MHTEALLSDIYNNAMSAGELVRCELQQSGQLLLRVAADACVFQAVAGAVGRQVLAAPIAPSPRWSGREAKNVPVPPASPSETQERTQASCAQADGIHPASTHHLN